MSFEVVGKKISRRELMDTSQILDAVWERTCAKYEAFVEIDKEYGLDDSMTFDLKNILEAFSKVRLVDSSNGLTLAEIESVLRSIVDYNGKHKEVILITDSERSDLTSLVGFAFAQ